MQITGTETEADLWESMANHAREAAKAREIHNDLRVAARHRDIDDALDEMERRRLETALLQTGGSASVSIHG